ncbi:MAG: CapA family protein [Phenylobacterium sp.]|uniref:CapA family protein n=1 Tax=Phenylobacterium sp. TaxID=1871053 RepID=UPI00273674F0|nr:CapA family protein [Phenylobacterium sp.]MDP3749838.1 CapA family protein [Phenylobacterium sp.]
MHRRTFLASGLALAAAPARPEARPPLRVALLGQALIEHELSPAAWPGRAAIAARLAQAHACFTNLETVIKGPRAGAPSREALTLHAAGPAILDTLKAVNINLVATANNHAFDLGSGGILDTLDALRAAGLPSAGSGVDLGAASAPALIETPAGKVALVACATGKVREGGAAGAARAGVNEIRQDAARELLPEDVARVLDSIRAARARADVVIAYQHNHDWELDNADTPAWQRVFARTCAQAGASVFVGHGSPLLQGMEVHAGVPLLYGLGNFIFQTEKPPGAYPPEAWEGLVVDCVFEAGHCRSARLVPLALNEIGLGGQDDMATRGGPTFATPVQGVKILERVAARAKPFGGRIGIAAHGEGELLGL